MIVAQLGRDSDSDVARSQPAESHTNPLVPRAIPGPSARAARPGRGPTSRPRSRYRPSPREADLEGTRRLESPGLWRPCRPAERPRRGGTVRRPGRNSARSRLAARAHRCRVRSSRPHLPGRIRQAARRSACRSPDRHRHAIYGAPLEPWPGSGAGVERQLYSADQVPHGRMPLMPLWRRCCLTIIVTRLGLSSHVVMLLMLRAVRCTGARGVRRTRVRGQPRRRGRRCPPGIEVVLCESRRISTAG